MNIMNSPYAALLVLQLLLVSLLAGAVTVDANAERRAPSPEIGKIFRVIVTSLPFYGHFLPVKAIAEELALRGHNVTVLLENCKWVEGPAPLGCVPMPSSATFSPELLRNLSFYDTAGESWQPLFEQLLLHHEKQLGKYLGTAQQLMDQAGTSFDLLLTDISTLVGFGVAHRFNIPYASVYPLVMRLPHDIQPWLPLIGTGMPRKLSTVQRLATLGIGMILPLASHATMVGPANTVRERFGVRPFRSPAEVLGMESLVFAPTIWGYDIPQPLCPNIIPLGIVSPKLEVVPLEDELREMLDSRCEEGALYVNFGTLSWQTERAVEELLQSFLRMQTLCIVWKIVEADRSTRILRILQEQGQTRRFYVAKYFASPMAILSHPSVLAFVTHCGDTSVGEAVTAGVPLLGIPYFADQEDVCQRMEEAGMGVVVGHKHTFTAQQVLSSASLVIANRTKISSPPAKISFSPNRFVENVARAKMMARAFGGPSRAAAILEHQLSLGLLDDPNSGRSPLSCDVVTEADSLQRSGFWWILGWIVTWSVIWMTLWRLAGKRLGMKK